MGIRKPKNTKRNILKGYTESPSLDLKPGGTKTHCCKMMKNFDESLSGLQFNVSDGEITGSVIIYDNTKYITFNDGYRDYPHLELKYCPFCGELRP